MSKVTFEFNSDADINEQDEIAMCTHRHAMWCAINEVNNLIRKLYNGRTYNTEYFYPIGEQKSEFGAVRTIYSQQRPADVSQEKAVEFIKVDWIIDELSKSIEDIKFLVDY